MSCAACTAAELVADGGANALLVTHSTVIESLLASHFSMQFDSVHTTNLAYLVVVATPISSDTERSQTPDGWRWTIERMSGIECEKIVTAETDDVHQDHL